MKREEELPKESNEEMFCRLMKKWEADPPIPKSIKWMKQKGIFTVYTYARDFEIHPQSAWWIFKKYQEKGIVKLIQKGQSNRPAIYKFIKFTD